MAVISCPEEVGGASIPQIAGIDSWAFEREPKDRAEQLWNALTKKVDEVIGGGKYETLAIEGLHHAYDILYEMEHEAVTDAYPSLDPEKAKFDTLQQQIEALKEEAKAKDAAAKADAEAQAIESFKERISAAVAANKDEYELIAMHGDAGTELVYEVIHKSWEKNGKLMPMTDAFAKVEAYLLDEYNKSVSKFKTARKLAQHFSPPVDVRAAPAPSESAKREPPVTLSGQSGAASGSAAGPTTAAELRAAAIKALGG
jgi:Fe-S-cluster formation regulator IscX/YfhJ